MTYTAERIRERVTLLPKRRPAGGRARRALLVGLALALGACDEPPLCDDSHDAPSVYTRLTRLEGSQPWTGSVTGAVTRAGTTWVDVSCPRESGEDCELLGFANFETPGGDVWSVTSDIVDAFAGVAVDDVLTVTLESESEPFGSSYRWIHIRDAEGDTVLWQGRADFAVELMAPDSFSFRRGPTICRDPDVRDIERRRYALVADRDGERAVVGLDPETLGGFRIINGGVLHDSTDLVIPMFIAHSASVAIMPE